jgi:subtilisin family serine protease
MVFLATAATAFASPYQNQWALENSGQNACRFDGTNCQAGTPGADIKAPQAWTKNRDCSSIVTAVLDTGADLHHPDLENNLLPGKNFVGDTVSDDAQDDNLHGTHVSGIIAASGNEASGVVGVCQKAKVLPVKVGSAEGYLTDADVLEGIQYAVSMNAKVVNASFGGGEPNELVKEAIANAKDTLFVIAAGNGDWFGNGYDIDSNPVYPASYGLDNIIAVAATDNRDQLGSFSNYGVNTVALAAPGVSILSTLPMQPTSEMTQNSIPTEMGTLDGTSMATPHVTGAVALLWSTHPEMSAADVKARVLQAVDKLDSLAGKVKSGGRLDLAKLF